MLKEWLDEKNIKYENIMVDSDNAAAEEMIKKSGQMGVPVTIVTTDNKEKIVIGFDKEKLGKLLDIK